ncbi:MAG: cryptochrome/photolyase family protein [Gaiellales bacterium]
MAPPVLVWLRRDLRLDDSHAIGEALAADGDLAFLYVLDPAMKARGVGHAQLGFIVEGLIDLQGRLAERGGGLIVRRGDTVQHLVEVARELGVERVCSNRDEEPAAGVMERAAEAALREAGVELTVLDDEVNVPHELVLTKEGRPCRTYSAYARAVRRVLAELPAPPVEHDLAGRLLPVPAPAIPDVETLVGGPVRHRADVAGGETLALARLRSWRDEGYLARYADDRDLVAEPDATSRLSAYLRQGMLSPRRALQVADRAGAPKWASELLWRDWFKYALHHHPDLDTRCVDERFDRIEWTGSDEHFEAWTRGETGYGMVDAAMRQLAETGNIANRARMVAASFLVKDLHVDWRRGEQWFRRHLADGDLASNAGSWQWVAGTGLDAAPYFRIFNPDLQERKFDPDGAYVSRWAPDSPGLLRIVDHAVERDVTLAAYKAVAAELEDPYAS